MSREVTQPTQPPSDPSNAAKQSRTRTLVTRFLASAAVTAGVLWLFVKAGLDFVPPWDRLGRLDTWVWVQFVALWLLGTFMRVHRWVHLLRPIEPRVPKLRVVAIGLVAYTALFAPMRMGEFVRPVLISRDKQVGFTQALGTVAAERIVDGVVASVMLALGYFVLAPPPLRDHVQVGDLSLSAALVPTTALGAMSVFVSAFVAMVVFYFWRKQARSLVLRLVGLVSKTFATWLTLQVERLSDSLTFLFSRRHGLAFVRDTLIFWVLSVASVLVILRGTGVPLSAAQATVILGVQVLGVAVPGPPGFFGTFQMGFNLGLALYFPELVKSAGEVAVFVSYGVQLLTAATCLPVGLAILARTRPPVPTTEPREA